MALSRAMSSSRSGLNAHNTAMDVVGNNIANVNTYGFKASRISFRDSLYQTLSAASGSGYVSATSDTGRGGRNPMQVGYGVSASAIQVDTGSPGFTTTGSPTDCYISGDGYFVTSTGATTDNPPKPAGLQYTRVGQMQFDTAGFLTDVNGNRILGANSISGMGNALSDTSKPATLSDNKAGTLQFIYYDPSKNTLKDVKIASDGTITATDSASGKVVTVGQIKVARFNNPAGLQQDGNSYYEPTANSGDPQCAAPGTGGTGTLTPGALEASNVDLANEFSNMIVYERGFQANSKIMTVSDEMLQTLVNMKG